LAQTWQLAEAVALRPEAFGGMAFHRDRGITLELDGDAYGFLCSCLTPGPLPSANHPAAHLVSQLVRLGFLQSTTRTAAPVRAPPRVPWTGSGITLSAPETVHLAITTRCNCSCPGCYIPRREGESELTIADWRDLVAQWAQMRVFQIAVGGGEPLLYDGLFEVLSCARQHGLVANLTTNGTLLDKEAVLHLEEAGVARVNVSWNSPGGDDWGRGQAVRRALELLLGSTIQVGVNMLITPTLLPRLSQMLAQLRALGIRRVTVLRPKPPAILGDGDTAWYDSNRLRRADLLRLRDVLTAWQGALALEVDSALAGLMSNADPTHLRWRGIHGCTAGQRICTVWPDGRVTACSFLGDLTAGNVLTMAFTELWEQGRNWGLLRDPFARLQGSCAGCAVAVYCGGVRCIARHGGSKTSTGSFCDTVSVGLLTGDAECPQYRKATRFSYPPSSF
jgi:radical SAM protein with 4Fe4S-binding SPASM domain